MASDHSIYENLKQLGKKTPFPESPEKAVLERVPNPQAGVKYCVRFTAPEFTSLCPITSQPDFAYLMIDYVPDRWLVESKSLKLYLGSFRNHGAFHATVRRCAIVKSPIKCTETLFDRFFRQTGNLESPHHSLGRMITNAA